jgi:hypothetical protein
MKPIGRACFIQDSRDVVEMVVIADMICAPLDHAIDGAR